MSNNNDAEKAIVEVISSDVDKPLPPGHEYREAGYHLQKTNESSATQVVLKPSATSRKLYDLQRVKEAAAVGVGFLPVSGAWLIWLSQTLVDYLDGSLLFPSLGYYGRFMLLASIPLWKLGLSRSRLEEQLARRVLPEKQAGHLVEVTQRKRRWAVPVGFVLSLALPLFPVSLPLSLGAWALGALGLRCLYLPWKNEPRHPAIQGSLKDGIVSALIATALALTGALTSFWLAGILLLVCTIATRLVQDAQERNDAVLPKADSDQPRLTDNS